MARNTHHEARTHRPYDVDPRLEGIFEDTRLLVGGSQCSPGGFVDIDERTYLNASIDLEWARSDDAFEAFKFSLRDGVEMSGTVTDFVTLLVVGRTPYLKFTEKLFSICVADIRDLSRRTNLSHGTHRSDVLNALSSGCEVTVALVLNQAIPNAEQHRPRAKGYWLARTTFATTSPRHAPIWYPQMLDDQVRRRLELTPETVSFVELGDNADVSAPLGDSTPILWIDEEIWAALAEDPRSATSYATQWQLGMTFVRETLFRFAFEVSEDRAALTEEHNAELLRNSLVGRLISAIARKQAKLPERLALLDQARREPELVAALAEERFGIKKSLLASLRRA